MKLIGIFLFFSLLAISGPVYSQVLNSENLRNVDVSTLSDEEIRTYYNKAKSTGLSEEQLYSLAIQRGMPENQVQKLRDRIASLGLQSSGQGGAKTATKTEKGGDALTKQPSDESGKPSFVKVNRDSTIFGSELFTEVSTVFEPNYKIATPASYVLGPGDELSIQVFGYSEQSYNVAVNAEGNIYIPNAGPIAVSGLSVDDASVKIKNKLAATIYKAIKTGQTKVQVSLGKIRSISVSVIGQVTKPGTYSVSSLSTLFNFLYICGGPSNMGSYRKIEIIRGNKTYRTVDLYGFLLRGDRKDNVLLQDQDVVRIPYYDTRVSIEGEVRRPGKFEMLAHENVDQLMTYAGGYSDSAYRGSIKVIRISDTGRVLADLPLTSFGSFEPRSGDAFMVSKAMSRFTNRITIRGAVYRPGDFELKPGMQLKELIELAGGTLPDAYQPRGLVARLKEDQTASSVSFNVTDVLAGKEKLSLRKDDIVTISSIFELKDAQTLEVEGAVRKPGRLSYRDSLSLLDAIVLSGGFAEGADLSAVQISRRMEQVDVFSAQYKQAEVINVDLSNGLSGSQATQLLSPNDLVLVRFKGGYEKQRSVTIGGQVISPGKYALQSSRETISEVVRRAGGFRGSADSTSISIRRATNYNLSAEERQATMERFLNLSRDSIMANPSLREAYLHDMDFLSVNVQKIKDNPGGPEDLILEDGDYIEIARASNLVRISGEVFHPSLLAFENGANAKYYIKRSGDFTSNARKTKTFVIYPDGRAKSVGRFLFVKTYPKVTPRSEVFVPSKEKETKKGFSTAEWIAISSIVATLATMVITVVDTLK
ncbi:MAG TPA: SLBB domain-containing protein [Phnomibacter sp.]|nr:SLBB domain-containing protein [Phnomibacter sp.]